MDNNNESLILLATTQECMLDVVDKMEQWDSSKLSTENSAFEAMNISDKVLNMSKEGGRLVGQLENCYKSMTIAPPADEYLKMTALLEEIKNVFQNIIVASEDVNEITHKIEGEVAAQKEIQEDITKQLVRVGNSIDSAIALSELRMVEY